LAPVGPQLFHPAVNLVEDQNRIRLCSCAARRRGVESAGAVGEQAVFSGTAGDRIGILAAAVAVRSVATSVPGSVAYPGVLSVGEDGRLGLGFDEFFLGTGTPAVSHRG
jgi:hypothetical protein